MFNISKNIKKIYHHVKLKVMNIIYDGRKREVLAPKLLAQGDEGYESVLDLKFALKNKACRNIAVTGINGSGKSSVINTCLNSCWRKRHTLRISLSNYWQSSLVLPSLKRKNDKSANNLNKNIEYTIFQHILYKADQRKTAKSNFRRYSYLKCWHVALLGVFFLILVFAICLLLGKLHNVVPTEVFNVYHKLVKLDVRQIIRLYSTIVSFVFVLLFSLCVFSYIFRHFPRLKSFKFQANDYQVEIEKDADVFNRLLDEILYFLKAGGYRYVIFEDIDRVPNTEHLFLKFREINLLLNESEYFRRHRRVIRFIYAIRDDVFIDEIRTKFFDYIVPVIPVVDRYNNGDYILNNYANLVKDIPSRDVAVMGMYIRDKRELTNIMNEYQLYNTQLLTQDSMTATKLLAMIIYKNLIPQDYARAYRKKGYLYTAFYDKKRFYCDLITNDEKALEASIAQCESQRDGIADLRRRIITQLELNNVHELYVDGKPHPLNDFQNDGILFDLIRYDKIKKYVYLSIDEIADCDYDFKFANLSEMAFGEKGRNFEDLLREYEMVIHRSVKESMETQKRIDNVKNQKLQSLLYMLPSSIFIEIMDEIIAEVDEHKQDRERLMHRDLLLTFIRSGFIAEDFPSYMSFTYPGMLQEGDFYFINSVLQGISLPYSYELNAVPSIIERLSTDNFKEKCILNFSLIDTMLSRGEWDTYVDLFLHTASKNFDFLTAYAKREDVKIDFFKQLFSLWTDAVLDISKCEDEQKRDILWREFFKTLPLDNILTDTERNILSQLYPLICSNINTFNISDLLKYLKSQHVVFSGLVPPTEATKEMYSEVLNASMFEITSDNLKVIYGEKYDHQSLTSIIDDELDVSDYVCHDVNKLLDLFPESDTEEAPEATLWLANQKNVDSEKFERYLRRQTKKISPEEMIVEERLMLLFKFDLIIPTWENVRLAYKNISNTKVVTDYVNKHAVELSKNKMQDGDENLQCILLDNNNALSLESYQLVAQSALYYVNPDQIEGLSEERIAVLLDKECFQYNDASTSFVSKYSHKIIAKYLIQNMESIMLDENDIDFTNSNALGCEILKSDLPIEQKLFFLDKYGDLDKESEDKWEYAQLICVLYHDAELDDAANYDLVIDALETYTTAGCWQTKIELINKVHRSSPYDSIHTTRMLHSLGTPYNELNTYAHNSTSLHDNVQNNELVDYLLSHTPYLCRKLPPENGEFKVTYRKSPKT